MTDNTPPTVPTLPPRQKSRRGAVIGAAVIALIVGSGAGFATGRATASGDPASGPQLTTVKIGVTDADQPYWPVYKKLAREHGIDLQTVNFQDYTQANPALTQGQLDLNLFQHLVFLSDYDKKAHQTLTPIGSTYVVPLSLYSTKYTKLQQIPKGGSIAIPNDPTNQGRALQVLQAAGLLKLKDPKNILATPAEIIAGESRVKVKAVDAAQTVTALPSVDGAVVNNNFALDGHLDPSKALYSDNPKSALAQPYINVIVARAADKDNKTYAEVVKLYHDPRVEKLVTAESKDTSVPIHRSAADLQRILAGMTHAAS